MTIEELREEIRAMEYSYCNRIIQMIQDCFDTIPRETLLNSLEAAMLHQAHAVEVIATTYAEQVALEMQKQAWLQNKWVETGQQLSQLENTHQHLIAVTMMKSVAGRKDVREITGEHGCRANSDKGAEFGYCDLPAVAEVMVTGGWRMVCQSHLERLPPIERRNQ